MNQQTKQCQNCKNKFTIELDDFDFYKKLKVPAPTLCPDCRMKRKLVWRNENVFYNRTCDFCRKTIITMYHPRYPSPVYCYKCYISEEGDPYEYGFLYDKNKSFFEQFNKLLIRVPKMATYIGTAEGSQNINSEYINFAGGNKNCYLLFSSAGNEDCSYSRSLLKSRSTLDTYFAHQVELCYESININKSNKIFYGQNVLNSIDSYFLLNCTNAQNCFGCVNLRHKSYYFFNKSLSRDTWLKTVSGIIGSYQKMKQARKKFEQFSLKFPRKESSNMKVVNCAGEYIFESKNCFSCFEAVACEDCKYAFSIKFTKDSYDVLGRGLYSELLLETVATGHGCSQVIGTWGVEASHDIAYSYDIKSSEHCIGCVGLKHAKFCILNKKYSKEEYNKLKDHIVKGLKSEDLYGLYFPPEISPWAYNETLAQESFPTSEKQAYKDGFRWETDIPRSRGQETLKPDQIPDHIKDVENNILKQVLVCVNCGYNYRLIPSELEFYKRMLIPVPRKCFNCRYLDRLRRRGPFKLYSRECDKCKKLIKTTYSPDRPEIIYCEKCYQTEVI